MHRKTYSNEQRQESESLQRRQRSNEKRKSQRRDKQERLQTPRSRSEKGSKDKSVSGSEKRKTKRKISNNNLLDNSPIKTFKRSITSGKDDNSLDEIFVRKTRKIISNAHVILNQDQSKGKYNLPKRSSVQTDILPTKLQAPQNLLSKSYKSNQDKVSQGTYKTKGLEAFR